MSATNKVSVEHHDRYPSAFGAGAANPYLLPSLLALHSMQNLNFVAACFDCNWQVVPQSYLLLEHLYRLSIGTVLGGALHSDPAKMPDVRLVYMLPAHATAGQGDLAPASQHLKSMPAVLRCYSRAQALRLKS